MDMSREDSSEIQEDLDRIETLLSTDIFEPHNHRHPLVRSAFIDLIICLDDLMSKASYYGRRVDFVDDILNTVETQSNKKRQVHDATSLINFVRNAVCHIYEVNRICGGVESRNNGKEKIPKGAKVFFNRTFGKGGTFQKEKSKYDDDQSFAIGEHIIYLKRHIIRAYEEARRELLVKYPMIYPADALDRGEFQNYSRKPKLVEREHTIKVMVEDGPYLQAIEKFDEERFGLEIGDTPPE